MKIGIMGAMPEEVIDIKQMMKNVTKHTYAGRIFYSGFLEDLPVVLTISRWGKVASATTATALIQEFDITHLIFTGVAGSTHKNVNIGDIVISKTLYQHDMDATPVFKKHEIPMTGKIDFDAEKTLIEKALEACKHFLKSKDKNIPSAVFKNFNIDKPKVLLGTIGSGDEFVNSTDRIKEILSHKPETVALEMEGGAVAQVCYDCDIPFVVIRTISDKADSDAHVDFTKFIEEVASHYSAAIVKNICTLLHKNNIS